VEEGEKGGLGGDLAGLSNCPEVLPCLSSALSLTVYSRKIRSTVPRGSSVEAQGSMKDDVVAGMAAFSRRCLSWGKVFFIQPYILFGQESCVCPSVCRT